MSAQQRTYQQILSSTQDSEPQNDPEPPTPTSLGFNRSSSYTPSLPTISDSTSFSNQSSRTVRDLPEVPLQPLRPNRESSSHLSLTEPSVIATSDAGSVTEQNHHYPLDVKTRLQPDESTTYVAPSTSNSRSGALLARAPTYASTSTSGRQPRGVYVIDENDEPPDVPPEYGRHTDDTSCTPSIISSGLGRIPSSYISSGRF